MMARSTTRSNQKPDTLMQDHINQSCRNLLRRTAGPYIWVILGCYRTATLASGAPQSTDIKTTLPVEPVNARRAGEPQAAVPVPANYESGLFYLVIFRVSP